MAPPRHATGRATGKRINDFSTAPKKASKPSIPSAPTEQATLRPAPQHDGYLSLYQTVLNVFNAAFPDLLDPSTLDQHLHPILQQVKTHLFNRDFDSAFGQREHLEAYAARWSASRALGYVEVFKEVCDEIILPPQLQMPQEGPASLDISALSLSARKPGGELTVVCLGGGAGAELCALVGMLQAGSDDSSSTGPEEQKSIETIDVTLVDIADWSSVIASLTNALTHPLKVSQFASAAVKAAASKSLISPDRLRASFVQTDVLDPGSKSDELRQTLAEASLVTLAFTLNELYTTSIPQTQKFLLNLTTSVQKDALLLVVDSAGSYSTVTVNGNEKKYPMQWLLDHTLTKLAPEALAAWRDDDSSESETNKDSTADSRITSQREAGSPPRPVWQKLTSEASRWFRLPQGLKYPIELENMRYQMALYRRI